jgi:DNA mismatch repair protein MutS2
MDDKTLTILEYPKILERLAEYASFSASLDLARAMRPSDNLDEARMWQAQVSEARRLLSVNADVSIGGAHDVRPLVDLAAHGGVLTPAELLSVRATLISARTLARTFERLGSEYPRLTAIASGLPAPAGLVDVISRAISERGEVLDSASPKLGSIRSELKIAHERLMSRLTRIVNDAGTTPLLQEALITQRNGRYVLPLRAEFKGRLRSIIHDQSASGATLFVEPLVVVELNNHWRELQLAERDEERRILAEISNEIGEQAVEIARSVDILAELDLAFMRAKYAEDLRAAEPELLPFNKIPGKLHPGSVIHLFQARHPLLNQDTVVPIDIELDADTFAVLITGPNTGGKTVTLKTVGLLALMAQSGLHIPAQSGSQLSLFHTIYADIGDEQSIEQSLSTFSGHVKNLVSILKYADHHSLVLLDELGAGTDPQEGSALARAVMAHLLDRQITTLVATHYPELKAFAHSTQGVTNASVEFDLQTLRPTYHLIIGLPGRSNALAIAERLGLPAKIVEAARATIDPNDLRAEDLLDEIHRQRDLARKARGAAEKARQEADSLRVSLSMRLERIEDERRAVLEKARSESEAETAALRFEMDEVRRALARARQPVEALKPVEEQLQEVEEQVEQPVERKTPKLGKTIRRGPLRLGDKVRVRSLKMEGLVSTLGENEVEVQLGALRVRARLSDIQRVGEEEETLIPPPAPSRPREVDTDVTIDANSPFSPSPGMELDLRGQRAEDALEALERYLESAYLAGLPYVRVIHGKGTGRLRQVVREALHQSAHVKSFEMGQDKEGGDGVTVAKLNTD